MQSIEDQISERMKDALGGQEARLAQAKETQSQMLEAAGRRRRDGRRRPAI